MEPYDHRKICRFLAVFMAWLDILPTRCTISTSRGKDARLLIYPTGTSALDFKPGSYPDYNDARYYRTDYTRQQVASFLGDVKRCVRDGNFIVLENAGREDNKEFLNAYGLYRRSDQQRFLLSIDVDEFCHSKLTNDGRELFVFCAERELYKTMIGSCKVKAYIKHDYRKLNHPFDTVISMHELKLPIELLFVD